MEWPRPRRKELRWAHRQLRAFYGPRPPRRERGSLLDALVGTILSQNTSDTNSDRAFESLKARFPDWEAVRQASLEEVEEAIRVGGLARIKAQRIQNLLEEVRERYGETSLEHLREAPTEEIKAVLGGFAGVGPKTVACVLLFALGRPEFPVDTHVHRIARRLGWVPPTASPEQTYAHLNPRVPDDIKYELHVLLVHHGRQLCRASKPRCQACPLQAGCDEGRRTTG